MKNFNLLLLTSIFTVVVGLAFIQPMKQYEYLGAYKFKKKPPLEQRVDGRATIRTEQLRNVETGLVNPDDWYRVNAQIEREFGGKLSSRGDALEWQQQGPDQVGGRIRGFVFDKLKDGRVYCGGVSGGMYVSDDLGFNWRPVKDMANVFKIMSIGCMTQSKDGDIYAGTGEFWGNSPTGELTSQFYGNGIYKLKAGEEDWTLMTSTTTSTLTTVSSGDNFSQVLDISCDPTNNDIVYAATTKGLQISIDGGNTWKRSTTASTNMIAQVKVAIDGTVYAGWSGKVFKSTDKGNTWTDLIKTNAAYTADISNGNKQHLRIALSQQDANKLYVSGITNIGDLKYVIRSIDGGTTWEKIGQSDITLNPLCTELNGGKHCQGWYDFCLAVHPLDDEKIFLGGSVKTYNWSRRYGWIQMSNWSGPGILGVNLIHADNHEFAFHPTHPDTMVICTDGGPYITYNSNSSFPTPSWKPIFTKFNVTQFYDMAVNVYGELVGGAQDNGTQFVTLNNKGNVALEVKGGDGFDAEISAANDYQVAYATSYNGAVSRTANLTTNSTSLATGCVATGGNFQGVGFHTKIGLVEKVNTSATPHEVEKSFLFVFDAAGRYSMSMNAHILNAPTVEWTFWENPGVGEIRGLHSSKDLDALYMCGAGGIKKCTNLLSFDTLNYHPTQTTRPCRKSPLTWTTTITGTSGSLSDVYVDQTDKNRVVTVQYGFGGTTKVYLSTDGANFKGKQGNLPVMPVYSCAIDPTDNKHVVIGTEFGIWETFDIDATSPEWVESNKEIGRVPVFKLRVNDLINEPGCTMLYAGTHGRGFWRAPFPKKSSCTYERIPRKVTSAVNTLNNIKIKFDVYPNPTTDKVNVIFQADKPSTYQVMIYDMRGRIVKNITYRAIPGENSINADLSSLQNGQYIVRLEDNKNVVGGRILTKN